MRKRNQKQESFEHQSEIVSACNGFSHCTRKERLSAIFKEMDARTQITRTPTRAKRQDLRCTLKNVTLAS